MPRRCPRKLFWRYKANAQRAVRDGDYKFLKILDNTFLFNVVDDPLERANLKDRQEDIYRRLSESGIDWNATMLPEIKEALPTASMARSLPTTSERKNLTRCRTFRIRRTIRPEPPGPKWKISVLGRVPVTGQNGVRGDQW